MFASDIVADLCMPQIFVAYTCMTRVSNFENGSNEMRMSYLLVAPGEGGPKIHMVDCVNKSSIHVELPSM